MLQQGTLKSKVVMPQWERPPLKDLHLKEFSSIGSCLSERAISKFGQHYKYEIKPPQVFIFAPRSYLRFPCTGKY